MDCEKFDRILLDLLYEELDDITSAAATRHTAQCPRCRAIIQEFRATREVGALPLVQEPASLEQRILDSELTARKSLPLRQRMGRAVSVMAGYAMRPQLAMAALLLLLIGSSLLLLRAEPGSTSAMSVTERGTPEEDNDGVAIVAAESRPAAAPQPTLQAELAAELADDSADMKARSGADDTFALAMREYQSENWVAAQAGFDQVVKAGEEKAPEASLFSAQAVRNASGCYTAGPLFEAVTTRYAGNSVALDAHWYAAECFRETSQTDRAQRHYQALLNQPGYDSRARKVLAQLGEPADGNALAAKARAATPPATATAGNSGAAVKAESSGQTPAAKAAASKPAAAATNTAKPAASEKSPE